MKRKILAIIYILLLAFCCYTFLSYIFYYNNGNSHYRKRDYTAAIEAYEKALKANPPEQKECSIRINMALAIIYNIGSDYAKPDKIEGTIETLKQAREVLLEVGCATEDGDGHSETAEQLKDEIDAIIEDLENRSQQMGTDADTPDEGMEPEQDDPEQEQSIKEELMENQSESYLERQEELQFYEEFNYEMNFDYDAHIW